MRVQQQSGFIKQGIIFLIGAVLIGTHLLSGWNTQNLIMYPLGGYLVLSIYQAWRFAAARFNNLFSIAVFWLLPFSFVFCLISSMLYGLFMSIPKMIIAFYYWQKQQKMKPAYDAMSEEHPQTVGYQSMIKKSLKYQANRPALSGPQTKNSNIVIFPGTKR